VRITLDISINFHIGKDETRAEDCEKFLYYLGANRLQELLEQECNEKVRMLVRRTHVRNVRDLKSEMAHEILEDLGQRFNPLGIYFESVTIMNVIIPKDLRAALSTSTAFDVHLQNQIKFQGKSITISQSYLLENTVIKLNNS
jgi:regulator of protease activity HflC (stomatin/prohibitin superfamily)